MLEQAADQLGQPSSPEAVPPLIEQADASQPPTGSIEQTDASQPLTGSIEQVDASQPPTGSIEQADASQPLTGSIEQADASQPLTGSIEQADASQPPNMLVEIFTPPIEYVDEQPPAEVIEQDSQETISSFDTALENLFLSGAPLPATDENPLSLLSLPIFIPANVVAVIRLLQTARVTVSALREGGSQKHPSYKWDLCVRFETPETVRALQSLQRRTKAHNLCSPDKASELLPQIAVLIEFLSSTVNRMQERLTTLGADPYDLGGSSMDTDGH